MLGRTLQIKVTEDINIQSDVWEVCTQQKGKWLWAESRVWRLWGSTVNIDMEQAGEQGSLGPVSSHFFDGGSEEVLQDTAIYQLSLPQTIPSLWEERTSVSICLGLCCDLYWRHQLYIFSRSWFGDLWLFPRQVMSVPLQNSLSLYLHLRTEFEYEGSPEFEAFLPKVWDLSQRFPIQGKSLNLPAERGVNPGDAIFKNTTRDEWKNTRLGINFAL